MAIVTYSACADCKEDFYTEDLNAEMVCSDCEFGYICNVCKSVLPDGVKVGFSHFGGAYLATCERCSFKCAYWDCACELRHDCAEEDEED